MPEMTKCLEHKPGEWSDSNFTVPGTCGQLKSSVVFRHRPHELCLDIPWDKRHGYADIISRVNSTAFLGVAPGKLLANHCELRGTMTAQGERRGILKVWFIEADQDWNTIYRPSAKEWQRLAPLIFEVSDMAKALGGEPVQADEPIVVGAQ